MIDVQGRFIELLTWIRDEGFWPEFFSPDDLFVVPIANVIKRYRDLGPHQRQIALWLPNEAKLKRIIKSRGYHGLNTHSRDGLHFAELLAEAKSFYGLGVGKTEALLSVLHAIRQEGQEAAA